MKRLFVLGLAVMALGANAFASGRGTILETLDSETTQSAISRYLRATPYQENDMEFFFGASKRTYENALAKGATDEEAFNKALGKTLLKMKDSLTTDQYKKFLLVLNQTVRNYEAANAVYVVER